MRRLIRAWTVFPLHIKLVQYIVHLEPLHIGNSPVAARSCERMSVHLPGMKRTLQARHLPRRKLGRRQTSATLRGGGKH
jgi:hypothetical protein